MFDKQDNPFFDSQKLPQVPMSAYVAWLDVMGVRAWMLRSLPVTANFVFKLHVAALEARGNSLIRLYPVMDGVYVVAQSRDEMRAFLAAVFMRLAGMFVRETVNEHRCLLKCAVAYGPVIHGTDIGADSSSIFQQETIYKNTVLLGMPMVYAVESEHLAPPLGIYVHTSAGDLISPKERKRSHVWWPWFPIDQSASGEVKSLRDALEAYFKWCEERSGVIDYAAARIAAHRAQARQYFVDG